MSTERDRQALSTPEPVLAAPGDENGSVQAEPTWWEEADQSYYAERRRWLIRLRWVAVGGVLLVILLSASHHWIEEVYKLLGVVLLMAVYNLFFSRRGKASRIHDSKEQQGKGIFQQVLCDLVSLTLLLHWSGGISNPFALFFAFHMAIGAMLLSTRVAISLGAVASALYGGTVMLEHFGLIPHYPLLIFLDSETGLSLSTSPLDSLALTVAYLIAFVLMLFGVIYFVQSVELRRREAEVRVHQREKVALTRERMARVGAISSGVAHTIRNPLHGVLNCLDLLRDELPARSENAEEYLELMSEGLSSIERVTRRLQALSGNRPPDPAPTDVQYLIQESVKFVSSEVEKKNLTLTIDVPAMPPVNVDSDLVIDAVVSLLDSAVAACDTGGKIRVSGNVQLQGEEKVCLEISNSGEALSDEQIEHLFDPFCTTTAVEERARLGLAIARRIVEEHEGKLSIVSEPGRGTTFQISLPVHSAPRPMAPSNE